MPDGVYMLIRDTGEALFNIKRDKKRSTVMTFSIVEYSTIANGSHNMFGKADRRKESAIDPLLDPAQVLGWIIDAPRLRERLSLKWAGSPDVLERAINGSDSKQFFGGNLEQIC
ncbi:MAG TPA: hypothetical protein VMP68_27160 [Candidatus Eisenbacteria bacterium]|nr:hypothetical protein [Candidatus Eisenbacteria bacterium]